MKEICFRGKSTYTKKQGKNFMGRGTVYVRKASQAGKSSFVQNTEDWSHWSSEMSEKATEAGESGTTTS
jgi:hypothetical protein